MNSDNILKDEKFWAALLGGIGCIALIWNLINNPNDWANILVNFTQIAVAIIVFIVAISTRERATNLVQLSKEALEKLANRYNDFLLPPRYNREKFDPEKSAGLMYLFITNADKNSTKRVKFIPIDPIAQGIVIIYVQRGTLVSGLNYKSEEVTPEEIKRIQILVHEAVNDYVKSKYEGFYELITIPDTKNEVSIIIDYDEVKMKKRKFIKALSDVAEIATETLYKMRKNPN